MSKSKKRLALLWFGWSGVLFVIFLFQSMLGNYGQEWADWDAAWGWFVPALLPTLSLITGVLVVDLLGQSVEERQVEPYLFWLTVGVSVFYLGTVSAAIFAQPMVPLPELELLERLAIPLGALQGLVTAFLGAFFVKSEQENARARREGEAPGQRTSR
jgi:hypothetical protein